MASGALGVTGVIIDIEFGVEGDLLVVASWGLTFSLSSSGGLLAVDIRACSSFWMISFSNDPPKIYMHYLKKQIVKFIQQLG